MRIIFTLVFVLNGSSLFAVNTSPEEEELRKLINTRVESEYRQMDCES